MTTTDLAKFGNREKAMAAVLLQAMTKKGLPDDFNDDEVTVMMNDQSGNVFLTNSDYQVAMMDGLELRSFYNCPYCGHEGFVSEMGHEPKNIECSEYMNDIGATKIKAKRHTKAA